MAALTEAASDAVRCARTLRSVDLPEPLSKCQMSVQAMTTRHHRHLRRAHERKQLACLDNAINIAKDSLRLLRLTVFDRDSDALPAEAADVGVGQLSVVAADHLLNVGHLAVTPPVRVCRKRSRGEGGRTWRWLLFVRRSPS